MYSNIKQQSSTNAKPQLFLHQPSIIYIHNISICCSVAKSCLTLCNPMDCSMPDFLVLRYLPEFAQTQHHWDWDRCHYTAVVTGQRRVRPFHCPLTKASATEHLTQVLGTMLHHQHHAKQKGVNPFINYLPAPSHSNIQ